MVILRSQKNHRFFYYFSLGLSFYPIITYDYLRDSVAETTTFQLKRDVMEVYPENKENVTGV